MQMGQDNFIRAAKGIVTGDEGFFKDIWLTPSQMATTGTRATASNSLPADAIVLDASGEDVIVGFTIPRDYDELADDLVLTLFARVQSGTSVPVTPSAVSSAIAGTDLAAKTGFSAPSATSIDAVEELELDLSDLTWVRNESVHVNFAAGTPVSTGVVHVIGARISYRSVLVSYDETDASANALR